ncbi:unnamed protein product [Lymnaea stagnalis]|uniref:Uncharacterized protein n=1 Tax=Lymnaea stagnalis TaxID=6523 RepID=A0AAV2ILA4_LYMST
MIGLIGFVIGVVSFFLHQLIERIDHLKWRITKDLLKDERIWEEWLFCAGYSMLFAATFVVVSFFWRPSAGGSGMPEVTGYLNGTQIRRIFSIRTLIAKFLSCVAAIGCGMPIIGSTWDILLSCVKQDITKEIMHVKFSKVQALVLD